MKLSKPVLTISLFFIIVNMSGCFVGDAAGIIVQAPFEVVDVILPDEAGGDVVETTGEVLGDTVDFLIPF